LRALCPRSNSNRTFVLEIERGHKADPFEQAVGVQQKTAAGIQGALGGPVTAFVYDWNMLPIEQQLWLNELESYKTYPPLQAPETYNLNQVIEMVRKGTDHPQN